MLRVKTALVLARCAAAFVTPISHTAPEARVLGDVMRSRAFGAVWHCEETKFHNAFVLNHRVHLNAIDAMSARWT